MAEVLRTGEARLWLALVAGGRKAMLTSRRLGSAALLFAALFTMGCGSEGPKGDPGDPGATGDPGSKGDPGKDGKDGADAVITGDVTGTVTDGTNPLKDVSVTVSPGTATATTDASGKFDLKGLDIGAYQLKFTATGYLDQSTIVMVTAKGTTTVSVSLAVDKSQEVPPTVSVTDNLLAGYGKPVSLKATAQGTGTLTYAWVQTAGPKVDLTGADTDTVSFTTVDFLTAKDPLAIKYARFGVIGVNPDEAGGYGFEVTVTDANGLTTKADVKVDATRPSPGIRNVAVGVPVFMQGDKTFPFVPFTPVCASNADCPTATSTCTVAKGTCGCTTDADCGGTASGLYCKGATPTTAGSCAAGCSAPGGTNGCPGGLTCNNATATAAGSCAGPQTTWNWQIDLSGASGSTATIQDATTQFPSFTPDVKGIYKVTEKVSGKTLTIYAGTWMGEMTKDYSAPAAVCGGCHNDNAAPDMWKQWKTTAHASALQRKIEGAAGPHFTEECISCHTVGYDKTANNGGFDDVEQGSGWTYPTKLQAGNWNTLVTNATLGQLAGIQCENCHGPQNQPNGGPHQSSLGSSPDFIARVSWSSDVCASCHQETPFHYKPSQWSVDGTADGGEFVGHANRDVAIREGAFERMAPSFVAATGAVVPQGNNLKHCARCHSAQGFAMYAQQINAGYAGYLTSDSNPLSASNHPATGSELKAKGLNLSEVESQTCTACHDPHYNNDTTNKYQLRIYDKVGALPNGMTNITGMGTGAICVACHNGRNAEHSDFAQNTLEFASGQYIALPQLVAWPTEHDGPQAEMMYGFSTYFTPRYTPSPHLAVVDTCAGCHVKIATGSEAASKQASNHAFGTDNTICATCHGSGTNVDGDALQAANQLQIEGLRALLASKMLKTIKDAINNVPATGNMVLAVRPYDAGSDKYWSSTSSYDPTKPLPTGWIDLVAGTSTAACTANLCVGGAKNGQACTVASDCAGKNIPTSIGLSYTKSGSMMIVLNLPYAVTPPASYSCSSTSLTCADGPNAGKACTVATAATDCPGYGFAPTNQLTVSFTAIATNQAVPNTLPGWPTAAKAYYTVWGPPAPTTGTTAGAYPTLPPNPAWIDPNTVQTLMKAYWNISVINNDGTKGVHNPTFFNDVIGKTSQALQTLP
jgi:hypothetical protein